MELYGAELPEGKSICPHIPNPYRDCYCFEINSTRAPEAIRYCAGHYRLCPIYQKMNYGIKTGNDNK